MFKAGRHQSGKFKEKRGEIKIYVHSWLKKSEVGNKAMWFWNKYLKPISNNQESLCSISQHRKISIVDFLKLFNIHYSI